MGSRAKCIIALVAVMLSFVEGEASAQYRRHSAGIKLGNEISANYNYRITTRSALNFTAGLVNPFTKDYQYLVFSGAYNYALNSNTEGLSPYIGAGFSTGVQYGEEDVDKSDKKFFYFSVDVPVGFQYYMPTKPAVIYLEWSPKFRLTNSFKFVPNSVALGVRFILRN